jgi:hypothetical protein
MDEQSIPLNTVFASKWENIVPQWAFKLNSALVAVENWQLKGHMQVIKKCLSKDLKD